MNPARKMSRVMSQLPAENNKTAEIVWARLFLGRALEDSVDDAHYIAGRLNKLNALAGDLEKELHSCSVPAEMFVNQLQRLRRAILPSRIKEPWLTIRKELGDDIPLMLLWAAHVLGGPSYNELSAEIQELIERLDEVDVLLDKRLLPERLTEIFDKHLSAMRDAAASIGSEGSDPFQRSVESLYFELSMSNEAKEAISKATPEQQTVLDRIKETIQKSGVLLGKVTNKASTANQVLQFVDRFKLMFDSAPPA